MKKWSKKDIDALDKIKSVHHFKEAKNKVIIPELIGKEKLHIQKVLEGLCCQFTEEYRFDDERKFRFDWAIPNYQIAIEYEGIFSTKSRHTTVSGYSTDIEKYNLATTKGLKLLRYTALNYTNIENDLNRLLKT